MRIVIFGISGYFGKKFKKFLINKGHEVIGERVDIRDYNKIRDYLSLNRPDMVVNAAGKTGKPNVDWCEKNVEETVQVNVCGAINIVSVCSELGIYCVHLGSGCVYEGDNNGKGFSEKDEPNFYGSIYSRTKLYSEKCLKEFNPLQLRIRIPIESKPNPKNVIDKLVKYDRIISINNSFTIVEDFLPASYELIIRKERGVFNMTNTGYMDHEYLMTRYKEIVDPDYNFQIMSLEDLSKITLAIRSNTVLDTSKREAIFVQMPDIKKRIIDILKIYKKNLS